MKPHLRYEIIAPLAKGDYATVYRAKDRELDREVAIKQIHQQYLEDPEQLERYWHEAQLLAKLEHPRIMTIYDIVRPRGWLVLELMQGSLSQIQNGAPIDLNVLRSALISALHALHFLAKNGIIHGDVKPSNLLVDRNNNVKLGDFGIARRMTGDAGSVLKGTTKYMAPEVLSDQFGDVGPHSDLYSLGFACYELMCGNHFDSLFPGLDMFGRDRQIAWMMWHSSPDRRLPDVNRVLQGVPDDLSFVIQKLVEKDPAKRYRTAEQVFQDLKKLGQGDAPGPSDEEKEATLDLARQAKRKRLFTFGALGVSVALSLAVLFMPSGPKTAPPAPKTKIEAGVLQDVKPGENVLYVAAREGEMTHGIQFDRELDRVFLNDRKVDLADLEKGDQIKIRYLKSDDNRETKEISATRALAVVNTGAIADLNIDAALVTLSSGDKGEALEIHVPQSSRLLFNEEPRLGSRPVELTDFKLGDQAVVSHVPEGNGRAAVSLHVTRKVPLAGAVVSVDTAGGKLVIRAGESATAPKRTLAVAKDCEISLNGATTVDGKLLTLADLLPEDKVQLEHDARVSKIAARRLFSVEGEVQGLADAASLIVKLAGREAPVRFTLAPSCKIELAGQRTPVDLDYLRRGDKAKITHSSPDLKNPQAAAIVVDALPDKSCWAVVIAQQNYDDKRLAEIGYAAADGKLLAATLAGRYRVPAEQLLYEEDVSRLKLERELDEFLKRVAPGSQLVVYYLGHAFLNPGGAVLAPKEFDRSKVEATGVSLKGILDRIEKCAAREKILLVDACHVAGGKPAVEPPSSAEIVESLKRPGSEKVSSNVTVIASCAKGEIGAVVEASGAPHSALALSTSAAFRGRADANRDLRVSGDELYDFIHRQFIDLSTESGSMHTPPRYLPDDRPERITQGGQEAIRKLLSHLSLPRLDQRVLTDDWLAARDLSPNQPEAQLAYGLVLLKHLKGADAMLQFEAVKVAHPKAALAHQALAWQHFGQGNLQSGLADLVQLIGSLEPGKDGVWSPYAVNCLEFASSLRQFAVKVTEKDDDRKRLIASQVSQLNDAIRALDETAKEHCREGLRRVDRQFNDLDMKISGAVEGVEKSSLEAKRKSVRTFANFNLVEATKHLTESLDK